MNSWVIYVHKPNSTRRRAPLALHNHTHHETRKPKTSYFRGEFGKKGDYTVL